MYKCNKCFLAVLLCCVAVLVFCVPVGAADKNALVYNPAASASALERASITISWITTKPARDLNGDTDAAYEALWLKALSTRDVSVEISNIDVKVFDVVDETFAQERVCSHDYTEVVEVGPVNIVSQGTYSSHTRCHKAVYSQYVLYRCYVCGSTFYNYANWESHSLY